MRAGRHSGRRRCQAQRCGSASRGLAHVEPRLAAVSAYHRGPERLRGTQFEFARHVFDRDGLAGVVESGNDRKGCAGRRSWPVQEQVVQECLVIPVGDSALVVVVPGTEPARSGGCHLLALQPVPRQFDSRDSPSNAIVVVDLREVRRAHDQTDPRSRGHGRLAETVGTPRSLALVRVERVSHHRNELRLSELVADQTASAEVGYTNKLEASRFDHVDRRTDSTAPFEHGRRARRRPPSEGVAHPNGSRA